MDIRDELHAALDQGDFPSQALLAQTLARLNEPAPPRRLAWPGPVAAGLIAAALVVTLLIVRGIGVTPAPTDSRPTMQVSSTTTGLVSFQWVSAQVAWVNLNSPDGGNVIARTVDGGRTWHRELSTTGLRVSPRAQFFNDRAAVVIGEPVATSNTQRFLTIWRTSDGGAGWQEYHLVLDPIAPGNLVVDSSYFLDSQRGWILLQALYMCGGCLVQDNSARVLQTTDGGAHWSQAVTIPYQAAGLWSGIKFITPETGFVSTTVGPLYVTHDGGKTWTMIRLPEPGVQDRFVGAVQEPVTFLSEKSSLIAIDRIEQVKVPCLDKSGHNVPLATNEPPYCQNPNSANHTIARYVLSSDDGGLTWAQLAEIPVSAEQPSRNPQPPVNFIDGNRWVVVGSRGVLETTNGGASWSTQRSIPLPAGWFVSGSQFTDTSRGWITLSDTEDAASRAAQKNTWPSGSASNFAMLATFDGGATWHQVSLPQA